MSNKYDHEYGGGYAYPIKENLISWAIIFLIAILIIMGGCNYAVASEIYTDQQIVNAIYKAEGGKNAQYKYGIRSIRYKDEVQARKICLQTVKNNRRRFKDYGYRYYGSYLQFLASRYCPTKSRNLSSNEVKLNKYWIKNVEYFLSKGV